MTRKKFMRDFIKKAQEGMEQTEESIIGTNDTNDGREALVKGFESAMKKAVVKAVAKNQFEKNQQQPAYFEQGGFFDPTRMGDDEAYAHHLNLMAAGNKDIFSQPEIMMAELGGQRAGGMVMNPFTNAYGELQKFTSGGIDPSTPELDGTNLVDPSDPYTRTFAGGGTQEEYQEYIDWYNEDAPAEGMSKAAPQSIEEWRAENYPQATKPKPKPSSVPGYNSQNAMLAAQAMAQAMGYNMPNTPMGTLMQSVNPFRINRRMQQGIPMIAGTNIPFEGMIGPNSKISEIYTDPRRFGKDAVHIKFVVPGQEGPLLGMDWQDQLAKSQNTEEVNAAKEQNKNELDKSTRSLKKDELDRYERSNVKGLTGESRVAIRAGERNVKGDIRRGLRQGPNDFYEGPVQEGMIAPMSDEEYMARVRANNAPNVLPVASRRGTGSGMSSVFEGLDVPDTMLTPPVIKETSVITSPVREETPVVIPPVIEEAPIVIPPVRKETPIVTTPNKSKKVKTDFKKDFFVEYGDKDYVYRDGQFYLRPQSESGIQDYEQRIQITDPKFIQTLKESSQGASIDDAPWKRTAGNPYMPPAQFDYTPGLTNIQEGVANYVKPVVPLTMAERTKKAAANPSSVQNVKLPGDNTLYYRDVEGNWSIDNEENYPKVTNKEVLKKLNAGKGKGADYYSLKDKPGYVYRLKADGSFAKLKKNADGTISNKATAIIKPGDKGYDYIDKSTNFIYRQVGGSVDNPFVNAYGDLQKFMAGGDDPSIPELTQDDIDDVYSKDTTDPYMPQAQYGGTPMYPDGGFVYNNPVDNRDNPVMADKDFFSMNTNQNSIPDYLEFQSTPDQEVDVKYKQKNQLGFQPAGLMPFVGDTARNVRGMQEGVMMDKFNNQNAMTSDGREQNDELISQGMFDVNTGKEIISGFEGIVGGGKGVGQQYYSKFGGQLDFEEGGEYDLSEEEIQALIDAGVDLTLLEDYED